MSRRVLIVEDHEQWRRHLSSTLEENDQWQVVGEVSDGLEAVRKAQALKPDLILLDIGLPILNGLEAARRILGQNPNARILFVSEQAGWDVAEAALGTGAHGYVAKSDVARELSQAMGAVIEGKRFVSARLAGRVVETANDERAARRHAVAFHSNESSLVDDYAGFAEGALAAGTTVIVLATSSRREQLHHRLQTRGVDVDRVTKEGRYLSRDAAASLAPFMVDDWPDEARFWRAASALIMRAARASNSEHPRVAACGECAPGLLRAGKAAAAIRLEQLWDEVTRTYDVDVLCEYSTDALRVDDEPHVFQEICAAHSAVRSH